MPLTVPLFVVWTPVFHLWFFLRLPVRPLFPLFLAVSLGIVLVEAALRREGVRDESIRLTENTVVDALQWMAARDPQPPPVRPLVLVTSHRRESFGAPMQEAFRGIRRLAERFPAVHFVFPVHPNPSVVLAADSLRGVPNIELTAPVDYRQLVRWMRAATLVITDSGGIQEEAPTFGKPTLVLRNTTERPEGLDAGVARLVGTDSDIIFTEAERLLTDRTAYEGIASARNPYGDGHAAERIADILAGRPFTPFEPSTLEAGRRSLHA